MSLHITDDRMRSDDCPNVADLQDGRWTVIGYPGRTFDRNQAITAMLLAELLTQRPFPTDRTDLLAATWRTELGITEADGPHTPTTTTPTDRPDDQRPDRASSLTATWGAASTPPRTATTPHNPAAIKQHEVTSS